MNNVSFSKRLVKIMKIRNLNQTELCKLTKIPSSTMSEYLIDKYKPKQDKIYKLAKVLNVNEAWLLGYDVPMEKVEDINFKTATDVEMSKEELKKLIEKNDINNIKFINIEEQDILDKFRNIDSHGKKTVKLILDSEYKRCSEELKI